MIKKLLLAFGLIVCNGSFAKTTTTDKLDQLNFSITFGSIMHSDFGMQGSGYLHFNMKDNWKTYWKFVGDGGMPLTIQGGNNIKNINLYWPKPHRFIDENDMTSFGYKGSVKIPFSYDIKYDDGNKDIKLELSGSYAVCKVLCIYHDFSKTITLPKNYENKAIDKEVQNILATIPQEGDANDFEIKINKDEKLVKINLEHFDDINDIEDIILQAGEDFKFLKPKIVNNNAVIKYEVLYDKAILDNQTLTVTITSHENNSLEFSQSISQILQKNLSLGKVLTMFLFAFVGGLILNIMPCVLPVVSLKLGQITHAKCKLTGKQQLFFTVVGILSSFMLLSLLVISLKLLGKSVGWGFHFQQPIFILVMMSILVGFAFSQIGIFNMRLKGASKIDSVFNEISPDSPLYHIFYGLVITLLATPCTAPMLGSAVGFALSQSSWLILSIFLCIALGLATPYILLLILPISPKSVLPKAGDWLNYVKYIAAFLLYVSALWLLLVLIAQTGLIAIALFILINLFIYMAFAGVRGRCKTLSRILLIALILSPLYVNYNASNGKENSILNWHEFDESIIEQKAEDGNIVFIDITAKWCLTCKFNKMRVLSNDEVIKSLSQEYVYLIRGDMTKMNETLLAFIQKHGRAGVPFNAIYKDGKFILLSEVLSKNDLIEGVSR